MERFQDPERLAALFARCRIPERLPWTAAYPAYHFFIYRRFASDF